MSRPIRVTVVYMHPKNDTFHRVNYPYSADQEPMDCFVDVAQKVVERTATGVRFTSVFVECEDTTCGYWAQDLGAGKQCRTIIEAALLQAGVRKEPVEVAP